MVSPNGIGVAVAARKRYVVTPEVIVFNLEIAGEQVTLNGYVNGPGCPLPILLGVRDAWATHEEETPTLEETGTVVEGVDADGKPTRTAVPGTLSPHRWVAKRDRARMGLHRDILRETIPGLTLEQANILASEGGPVAEMLADMRWIGDSRAADGDGPEGEVTAGSDTSTGPAESPDSSTATGTTLLSPA